MVSRLSNLFDLKNNLITGSSLEKMASVSGNHICYWEYNPITKFYNEESSYVGDETIKYHDFYWPNIFLTDQDRISYNHAVLNLLENKSPIDMRLEFKDLKKWIRISSEFHEESGIYRGTVKDITSEYMADLTLRNRTLELSAYDEGLDNYSIVARTDAKGKIIYANKEFCRLSKYTYDELIGQDHRIVNSGHHSKEFFTDMWQAIKSGISWRGRIKNKAKDGTFYWVDTIIVPINDENGKLEEMLSIRFDVTQAMLYKEENERFKKELELLKAQNPTSDMRVNKENILE